MGLTPIVTNCVHLPFRSYLKLFLLCKGAQPSLRRNVQKYFPYQGDTGVNILTWWPLSIYKTSHGSARALLFPKGELVLNWNTLLILFHQELRLKVSHLSHRIPRSSESYVSDDHSSSEDQLALECWSTLNLKSHIDSNSVCLNWVRD